MELSAKIKQKRHAPVIYPNSLFFFFPPKNSGSLSLLSERHVHSSKCLWTEVTSWC